MSIKADYDTLENFLNRTTESIVIPDYQRVYSWTNKQHQDLWNDIITNAPGHFLGSLIVDESTKRSRIIVDGQQRITTVIILLAAVQSVIIKNNLGGNKIDLDPFLTYKPQKEGNRPKVQSKNSTSDTSEYLEFILSKDKDDHPKFSENKRPNIVSNEAENIWNAWNFFNKKIENYIKNKSQPEQSELIEDLLDKVLLLSIVTIRFEGGENVNSVFGTLNSRGLPLSTSDHIKNHLLYVYTSIETDIHKVENFFKLWQEFIKILDTVYDQTGVEVDKFFRIWWIASGYGLIRDRQIYAKFEQKVNAENSKKILESLMFDSYSYSLLLTKQNIKDASGGYILPTEIADIFIESVGNLNILRVNQQIPMYVALIRLYRSGKINKNQIISMISLIENFHLVYTLSSGIPNKIEKKYPNTIKALLSTDVEFDYVRRRFNDNLYDLINKEQAIQGICNLIYTDKKGSDKNLIKFILERFAKEHRLTVPHGVPISIEHLLAQSTAKKLVLQNQSMDLWEI